MDKTAPQRKESGSVKQGSSSDFAVARMSMQRLFLEKQDQPLSIISKRACMEDGIVFEHLSPIQRLFMTNYRCPMCKLLPLYHLNLAHPKRVRCGKCGNLITFTNSGKYGRMRKKIAFRLWMSREAGGGV